MATNTQFAIAVHLMAALGYRAGEEIPSAALAKSINTSASFVRRVLAKLSKARLVATATGKGGCCWLARDPAQVTLRDIYRAVEPPRVFALHHYPELKSCPVSCHIKDALKRAQDAAQDSMERSLRAITLAQVIDGLKAR